MTDPLSSIFAHPKPLTPRQKFVLDAIGDFIQLHGWSPSFEEIGHACGLSSLATVSKHVHTLKQKGYLSIEPNRYRSMEIVNAPSRSLLDGYQAAIEKINGHMWRAYGIDIEVVDGNLEKTLTNALEAYAARVNQK